MQTIGAIPNRKDSGDEERKSEEMRGDGTPRDYREEISRYVIRNSLCDKNKN